MCFHKICKALRMTFGLKVKIKTFPSLFQGGDLGVSIGFENQLLQVAKSPSVWHLLPHLDNGIVGVWCERLLAVLTLLIYYLKLDDHGLLQNARLGHLILNGDLHTDSHSMFLSPNKSSIHQPDVFAKASDFLQTDSQQLSGLWLTVRPWRLVVPFAIPAALKHHFS